MWNSSVLCVQVVYPRLTKKKWLIMYIITFVVLLLFTTITIIVGNDTYFDTSGRNLYQLNILSEYELERYAFPPVLPTSESEIQEQVDLKNETILYRISSGPKSPKKIGKQPVFIENGILCDKDPCEVNKPKIAVAYILVDRGYDVWLGIGNTSIAESTLSNEENERKRLERVAQYILASTQANELTVMGHFHGSVQFFGMTAPRIINDEPQSKISRWLDYIPGVKTIKSLYKKGTGFLTRGYNNVVDRIGRKINYITDDSNIRDLKNTVMNAWGFMMTMVLPTFTIKNFSDMMDHPDVFLDTAQLIRKYGYQAESHQTETTDGYLLTIHRIPGNESMSAPKGGKPVVLLQHGILGSSADWVMLGPSQSLAYMLSDAGYDVWMGNSRGNTYSKAHVNFSASSSKFWEFSWHEMGIHDLPATINYILNATGQKQIHYVGHSQGCSILFVMLSEKPEYNEMIGKAALFAPVANTTNARSPIIGVFSKISMPLYYLIRVFGVNDFLPTNALLTKIGREVCEARSPYQVVCSNVLFMITGYDASLLNKTTIPIILGHVPAGSSIKQFFHYAQGRNSKKFRQFDYGNSKINNIVYNQTEPPEYLIENVKIPVQIYYAQNDLITDFRDIEMLANQLPNLRELYKVPNENFNHIGFTYATEAPKLIYEPLIKYLKNATLP
ncbi:PREDICTED: lipase 3-like isoform X3 [Ceratosolen solmsi marchali]|uniref:Lipase 3-like isoform X3 n=1 Tax=Ceratosolen solmsi marchali TaxID=326594 RepID=A0AAJ7DVX3_9HYME|nr:PREDICTED: lipase 3-like isoform X3 [Ceratosolen solmsi marchali]